MAENDSKLVPVNEEVSPTPAKINLEHVEGRWSDQEHQKFLFGVIKFGKDWKQVDEVVETRNSTQIRSHAQKYFLKFQKQQKDRKKAKNKSKVVFTQLEKQIINYFKLDQVTPFTPIEFVSVLRRGAGLEQQLQLLQKTEKKVTEQKMTKKEEKRNAQNKSQKPQIENDEEQSYFMRAIKHAPAGIIGFMGLIDVTNRDNPEDPETLIPAPRKRSFGLLDDHQDEEKLKQTIKNIHEGNQTNPIRQKQD